MSFINIRKSRGRNTQPCETQQELITLLETIFDLGRLCTL